MECSEGLRYRVSLIIRRYTDHTNFYCFFHIILVLLCIIVYVVVCLVCFCLILYIMNSYYYVYVFLLLRMFRSRYCFNVFCVLFVCKCVLYYCHRVSTQLQLSNISYKSHWPCTEVPANVTLSISITLSQAPLRPMAITELKDKIYMHSKIHKQTENAFIGLFFFF